MKRLNFDLGGRPRFVDDLETLQTNTYDAFEAQYKGKGAFTLFGVTPTTSPNNVSSGIVFIDGQVMPFSGATSVTYPIYLVKTSGLTESQQYADSVSRPLFNDIRAAHRTSIPPSGEFITVNSSGARRFTQDVLTIDLVGLKGNQNINGTKTFQNDLNVNGITTIQSTLIVNGENILDKINGKANISHTHAAGDVTSGVFSTARIPDLDALKITTGQFSSSRIPNLQISKILNLQSILDNKITLSQNPWSTLSGLKTNWTSSTGQQRLNTQNQVFLRGFVSKSGGATAGEVWATLTTNIRPSRSHRFTVTGGGSNFKRMWININTNGDVDIWEEGLSFGQSFSTNPSFHLDSIVYYLD